jgi:hypothetical protein
VTTGHKKNFIGAVAKIKNQPANPAIWTSSTSLSGYLADKIQLRKPWPGFILFTFLSQEVP